jgi:hypothetical protein
MPIARIDIAAGHPLAAQPQTPKPDPVRLFSWTKQIEFDSMVGTAPNQFLDRTGERVDLPPSETRQGP